MFLKKLKEKTWVYEVYRFLAGQKVEIKVKNKTIHYMMIEAHGNIGDNAITLATIDFLKKNFPEYSIEYYYEGYYKYKNINKIPKDNIIILLGGGSFGDIYNNARWQRKDIIKKFKKVKIIIFPQSICYLNQKKKQNDIKFFKKYDLNVLVREKKSLEVAKEFDNCKTLLVPDIVTSFKFVSNLERNGILVLKRNDVEAEIKSKDLFNKLDNMSIKYLIKKSDTIIKEKTVGIEKKKEIVENKLEEIASFELVITDRLHGLIFSYITNTPVIVLKANRKIKESYDTWFSDFKSIVYLDSFEDITSEMISEMIKMKVDNKKIFTHEEEERIVDFILNTSKH